ncbi:MAG: hypothetical protein ACK5LT_06110 [Lachnospirales bacterium]
MKKLLSLRLSVLLTSSSFSSVYASENNAINEGVNYENSQVYIYLMMCQ